MPILAHNTSNACSSYADSHGGMPEAGGDADLDEPPSLSSLRAGRLLTLKGAGTIGIWLWAISSLPVAAAASELDHTKTAVFSALIPILVIVSGILAGLTLGYLSLDMTTLNVLAKTGTPEQQKAAKAIMPIRKDGHLLLVTLLLANMIVNETLPIIADPVLGGGVQAVVISTALIVIFSEIIPQSVCTRYGLQIGSRMVWPVRVLIWIFFIIAYPVSRLLTYLLGAHSGVIYRRSELKELVAMHAADAGDRRGDLEPDTVNIVAGALDFQVKSVGVAMTPIAETFMLNFHTTRLDYETLGKIVHSGHSRIPVFEEITSKSDKPDEKPARKIVGVILTKQFILLDPEDATPLRDLPILPLPTVPDNLPLHSMLNTFQLGRSHIAVVAPLLPQFRQRQNSTSSSHSPSGSDQTHSKDSPGFLKSIFRRGSNSSTEGDTPGKTEEGNGNTQTLGEQYMLTNSKDFVKVAGSQVDMLTAMADVEHPVGIITLEDVLEELIGEEIADEFDVGPDGKTSLKPYIPDEYHSQVKKQRAMQDKSEKAKSTQAHRPNFPLFGKTSLFKTDKPVTMHSADLETKGLVEKEKEMNEKATPSSNAQPTIEAPVLQRKGTALGVMRQAAGSLLPTRSRSTPARPRNPDTSFSPKSVPPSPLLAVPMASPQEISENKDGDMKESETGGSLPIPQVKSADSPLRHGSAPPAHISGPADHPSTPGLGSVRSDQILSDAAMERGKRQASLLATAHSLAVAVPPLQMALAAPSSTSAPNSSASNRTKIFKLAPGTTPPTRTSTPDITREG